MHSCLEMLTESRVRQAPSCQTNLRLSTMCFDNAKINWQRIMDHMSLSIKLNVRVISITLVFVTADDFLRISTDQSL